MLFFKNLVHTKLFNSYIYGNCTRAILINDHAHSLRVGLCAYLSGTIHII